jgi:hypothetical protein
MQEGFVAPVAGETRPVASTVEPTPGGGPALDDPRALQILTTEHWSLLTARSLVYNETFARGGMFLAFLSATLLVLGLISTATGFSDAFLTVAAVILALDFFVGVATLGRISGASDEDLRYLQGMNRLRHAYHEMVPGLEPYFITSKYDDFASVAAFYGPPTAQSPLRSMLHGFTTMPAVISTICASVATVLVAILLVLLTHDPATAATGGLVTFAVLFGAFIVYGFRAATGFVRSMEARWPAPEAEVRTKGESEAQDGR